MERDRITAIILAGGQGKRMGSGIQKQYMLLAGKPLIYYALNAFQNSPVDDIILVTGAGEERYCQEEIVEKYGFDKVAAVVAGGRERYHSVYEGLRQAENSGYVLIHDGARPFVDSRMIARAAEGAREYGACVVGMPVKDTIKLADEDGYAKCTPDRKCLWMIQTPQAFSYDLVRSAYDKLFQDDKNLAGVTDDAMVVESMTCHRVKLIEGSYKNLKVTTPEDMAVAESLLIWQNT